jgi:hypothetical protein
MFEESRDYTNMKRIDDQFPMTFSRKLILHALGDCLPNCGSVAPYTAHSLYWSLKTAFELKWPGIYAEMKTCPTLSQIYRTLRDLRQAGLIVGIRQKNQHGWQPFWETGFQISTDIYKNRLIAECNDVHAKTKKAKFGLSLFGGEPFGFGLEPEAVHALIAQVKSLIQKTHPDKAPGFEAQFKLMQECEAWLKSCIPLSEQKVATVSKTATARIKSPM